jgi:NAD(P)H-dependent flavin oxidoreductase YrpB (nitropropane dioxygenase family)
LSEQLQIVLEEKVPIASFAMGDPVKYVDQIHSIGAKIISMVTNIEEWLRYCDGTRSRSGRA